MSTFNPYALFWGIVSFALGLFGIAAIVRARRSGLTAGAFTGDFYALCFIVVLAVIVLIPMSLLYVLFAFIPPDF